MKPFALVAVSAASLVCWAVLFAGFGAIPWSGVALFAAVAVAALVIVALFLQGTPPAALLLVALLSSPAFAQSTTEFKPQTSADQGLLLTLFIQYLLPIIMTGLSALLTWGMKLGVDWLKAKGETSKAMLAVATLAEGARSVVANAEATIKADLLEASKDGVITKEEGERIKQHALDELKKMPAPLLKTAASLFGGNIEGYLSGLIERTLVAQKAALPSSPAPVPVPAITAPVGP